MNDIDMTISTSTAHQEFVTSNVYPRSDFKALRSKLIKFRLVYHDGNAITPGPVTKVVVAANDGADVVTCRVSKAFGLHENAYVLMHFTAPYVAGKRIRPTFACIHEHAEVFMHVMQTHQTGLEDNITGTKRSEGDIEDIASSKIKRRRVDELEQERR